MIWLKKRSSGREVVDVQTRLLRLGYDLGLTGVDGIFGTETEKAVMNFQEKRERVVDGIVGPETWSEIVDAGYRLGDRQMYLKEPPLRGDDVRELQATLNNVGFNAGRVSGVFGNQTDRAVREFQKNVGLDADGIIGETTVQALDNFRMRVSSGGITGVWDRSALPQPDPLAERRVVVDNDGQNLPTEIAVALCDSIREAGAKPLSVPATIPQNDAKERAWFANAAEADLLIRIEQGEPDEFIKRGSVCEYFDNGEFFSARSKAIAGLLQDEIVSGLRVFDNGIEGKNLTILQATKMPAIIVRPFVLSDPKDAEIMSATGASVRVALAVTAALKRYWEK